MTLPVRLLPEARKEFDDASEWYEQRRAGLGPTFVQKVDEVLLRIGADPLRHAPVFVVVPIAVKADLVRAEIRRHFTHNLARVRNLSAIRSVTLDKERSRTRRKEGGVRGDVLRAAVVLLHATLEETLRELSEWKLPSSDPAAFAEVPLAGHAPKSRFSLQELATFRGMTIDQVIRLSVVEHLAVSSYNNLGDIRRLLNHLNLAEFPFDEYAADLAACMSRRHWIVHRADRSSVGVGSPSDTKPLSRSTVDAWIQVVEDFVHRLLAQIGEAE